MYKKVDSILIKKIMSITFQDQTSFRGAKYIKLRKKGVFLNMFTNFG